MTTINLLQEDRQQSLAEKKMVLFNIGFFLPMAILIIVVLGFGGLKLYNASLVSKDNDLKTRANQESAGIVWTDVDKIADFQSRLNKIGSVLPANDFYAGLLTQLEQSTVVNANVENLNNGQSGLLIKYNADNFLTVARQILSDKKTDYFSNVRVSDISRDPQTGKILFTLSASVKGKLF